MNILDKIKTHKKKKKKNLASSVREILRIFVARVKIYGYGSLKP